jgi:hypothetical protein
MIYTCLEMIRDCRENRAEGWSYFVSNYVPAIQRLVGHYRPAGATAAGATAAGADAAGAGAIEKVLLDIRSPEHSLFAWMEPMPERPFLAELRQEVLEALDRWAPWPDPDVAIDLETLAGALEPLTMLEKQAVWLETLGYDAGQAGTFLRTSPATIEKMRERAVERIRAGVDSWRTTVLADNMRRLGRQAETGTAQCLPSKAFLEVVDGRATWSEREGVERHVTGCWHCIDHFCRMLEVVELLRQIRPLSDQEAEPFLKLLGVEVEKRRGWKKLFGAR